MNGTLQASEQEPARRRVWPVGIRALRHRNYRLFFAGQLISVLGTWMQSVALAWLVYRFTGSALLLGLVGFADKIPIFLLGLAGGVVADRFDRHRVVITTQILSMLQALALWMLVAGGQITVTHIFILATISGIINAFDLPGRQSFIASMVAQDDLPNALALNSSVFNAARILGPAIAGIVVAAIGEGPCFLLNAISYIAVIGCLAMMRFDKRPGTAEVASTFQYLAKGLRFVWTTPPVRALLVLLGLASILGMPYVVLMPIFAGEILHSGARGLGTLMGCTGIGAFAGAATLARRASVKGLGRVTAAASIGFGLTLVVFSLSSDFLFSCLILVVTGFTMITQAASTNLLIQSFCPDELRGRVMSIYTIMLVGMTPFGSLMAGALAHTVGARVTVAVGGLLCAIAGIVFAAGIPRMRQFVQYRIPDSKTGP